MEIVIENPAESASSASPSLTAPTPTSVPEAPISAAETAVAAAAAALASPSLPTHSTAHSSTNSTMYSTTNSTMHSSTNSMMHSSMHSSTHPTTHPAPFQRAGSSPTWREPYGSESPTLPEVDSYYGAQRYRRAGNPSYAGSGGELDGATVISVRRVDKSGLLEVSEVEPPVDYWQGGRYPATGDALAAAHAATLARRIDRSGLLEAVPEVPDGCARGADDGVATTAASATPVIAPTGLDALQEARYDYQRVASRHPSLDAVDKVGQRLPVASSVTSTAGVPVTPPLRFQERVSRLSPSWNGRDQSSCPDSSASPMDLDAVYNRVYSSPPSIVSRYRWTNSPVGSTSMTRDGEGLSVDNGTTWTNANATTTVTTMTTSTKTITATPDLIESTQDASQDRDPAEKKREEHERGLPEGERAEAEGCEHSSIENLEERRVPLKPTNELLRGDNIQTVRVIILSEQL